MNLYLWLGCDDRLRGVRFGWLNALNRVCRSVGVFFPVTAEALIPLSCDDGACCMIPVSCSNPNALAPCANPSHVPPSSVLLFSNRAYSMSFRDRREPGPP